MCSSSPPPAPDYEGAAEATAEGNLEAARYTTDANRVNQITPWGSSQYTRAPFDQSGFDAAYSAWESSRPARPVFQGGVKNFQSDRDVASRYQAEVDAWLAKNPEPNKNDFMGQWSQQTTLSPEQQALYNANTRTNQSMADIGLAGLGATSDMFKTPLDFSGLGDYKNYDEMRQGIMDNMLTRSNTQIGQDREAMAAQLIAQGIPRGSEAFNREMTQLDQKQTDARQQAELGATQQTGEMINQSGKIRNQKIQEILTQRQNPLNELNAFRTGTQVSMPQFSAVPQQQTTLGPDYMGAASAQGNWDLAGWNADQARNNAIMGGLFDLTGAAITGKR